MKLNDNLKLILLERKKNAKYYVYMNRVMNNITLCKYDEETLLWIKTYIPEVISTEKYKAL
jgi:hypothetical protein